MYIKNNSLVLSTSVQFPDVQWLTFIYIAENPNTIKCIEYRLYSIKQIVVHLEQYRTNSVFYVIEIFFLFSMCNFNYKFISNFVFP